MTSGWELLTDKSAKETWNQALLKFSDYNIFQSFEWGEHKVFDNWTPKRWIKVGNDNEIESLFQGFVRVLPFKTGMILGTGGPIGGNNPWSEDLKKVIIKSLNLKRCYCRIIPFRELNNHDTDSLKHNGWKKPKHFLNTGLSMKLVLPLSLEEFLKLCSKNWRHNFNRAKKNNLLVQEWKNPSYEKIISVYNEMEDYKKLNSFYSKEELEHLFSKCSKNIILYSCENKEKELLGLRGCIVFNRKAWDLFAANTKKGRKVYASYALFGKLISHCSEIGVNIYDFGGIDPLLNQGVYNFKKGTGSSIVEYLGEWDWATSEWLRLLTNFVIKRKQVAYKMN